VQVSDSYRLAPGSGEINFAEFLRVLSAMPYGGFVSVECLPSPDSVEQAAGVLRLWTKTPPA
jgi:sugar phosphate isomerase/epimerase